MAAIIPTSKPKTIAMTMELMAKTIVFGKVSAIIELTDLPDFLKEVLKLGYFRTISSNRANQ